MYYEGVDTTEPYEAVRDKIIEAIRTRRMAKARTTYLSKLREGAKVSFLLTPRAGQYLHEGHAGTRFGGRPGTDCGIRRLRMPVLPADSTGGRQGAGRLQR